MFLNILTYIGLFFGGAIVFSFFVANPIMIFRVSFPMIKILDNAGKIYAKPARRQCYYHLAAFILIDIIVILLLVLWNNIMAWAGFGTGVLLAFLLSLKKTGMTDINKAEWLQKNIMFIKGDIDSAIDLFL